MSKVFDSLSGAGKAKKGRKRAVTALSDPNFNISSPFGTAQFTGSGINAQGGPGSSLVPGFEQTSAAFLEQAGAAPSGVFAGLTPQEVFEQTGGTALGSGELGEQGLSFLERAQQVLGSIESFDLSEFATERARQLGELARPGEERAANQLATRLFSQGRLGGDDTRSGVAFGELQQAQERAATERGLAAMADARTELLTRIGAGTSLASAGQGSLQAGQGLQLGNIQNFLTRVGGAQQFGLGQQTLQSSLLQNALGATGGINTALAPSQQNIVNLLAGAGLNLDRDRAIAQANLGGFGAEANARGGFTSGLISGLL